MTYQETLDYMFNSLPMYHLIGKAAYKADITNTVVMMNHLGHPERQFKSIHVAGTNGKGSVSHFLASVLAEGQRPDGTPLRVGLYTSPHLIDFRERIRINGEMISQDWVVRFVEQNKPFFESHDLSFFEMTVGMAFQYFAESHVDVAVVEVGLGGRLDSTNVITPQLSIITNIGLDHTQFLGDTLDKIAYEKAGIIKAGVPVVIGETQPETQPVFEHQAQELHAPIVFADQHFRIVPASDANTADHIASLPFTVLCDGVPQYGPMVSPMAGSYQLKNLATLMQAVRELQSLGYSVTTNQLSAGIAGVVSHTGLHGRWEQYGTRPALVCETAHNEDGVRAMLAKLKELPFQHLHLIYGCVNDKDYSHILQLIGTLQGSVTYYYTQPSVPRALPVATLIEAAKQHHMAGTDFPTVGLAIEVARRNAAPDDMILVTGSIFLVSDAVAYLRPR